MTLVCSVNTEMRRVTSVAVKDVQSLRPCAVGVAKGNGGAEVIPVVGRRVGFLVRCVRRGRLLRGDFEPAPLFFGTEGRGFAETKVDCVLRGCLRVTHRGGPLLMPRKVDYRSLERSGTVRLLRTKIPLVCVQSLLKRRSIIAARICTETSSLRGQGTLRDTFRGMSSSLGVPS